MPDQIDQENENNHYDNYQIVLDYNKEQQIID